MMVDGAEERQLKGPIEVLAPYTSNLAPSNRAPNRARRAHRCAMRLALSPLRLDVAAGHVAYEVKMTAALYAWTLKFDNEDPADVKNACLEATPLHVRLLIEFLAGRPSKDRRTTAAVAPASPNGEAGG